MTVSRRLLILVFALGSAGFCVAVPAWADREGFGMRRALVEVARVQPASVSIPGSKIWVEGLSQDRNCQPVANHLAATLESEMLNADSRLSSDEVQPDAILELTVLRCDGDEKWESRQVTKLKKVGEDADGDPIYREYETTVRYQVFNAQLVVAYKATVRRSGTSLDADSLESAFRSEHAEGRGAPSLGDIESHLVGEIVGRIVPRLAATNEVIRVLLPKGTLKELIPLAEADLWNRYLEALEREPARPAAEDESYRRYAIGLAYEVLGYRADDPETTLRYLEEAAIHYDEALDMNPEEKYFTRPFKGSWAVKAGKSAGQALLGVLGKGSTQPDASAMDAPPPIERVRSALGSYRQLISQREQLASLSPGGGGSSSGGKSLVGSPAEGGFGNDQVIDMVHAGLAEEIIIQAIEDTLSCNFNVTPQGLIQLSKAQVPSTVIKVMQTAACTR